MEKEKKEKKGGGGGKKSRHGRLQYLRFCLFEMYVNVVFVIRCLYSAVSLILVTERFII